MKTGCIRCTVIISGIWREHWETGLTDDETLESRYLGKKAIYIDEKGYNQGIITSVSKMWIGREGRIL